MSAFGASAIHIVLEAIVLTGGAMIVAFISGMDVRRRIALNVVITGLAVVVTYVLGLLTKRLLGAEI